MIFLSLFLIFCFLFPQAIDETDECFSVEEIQNEENDELVEVKLLFYDEV